MTHQPLEKNCRILIVDDSPPIHEDFRKILCPDCDNGSEAISHMEEKLFGEKRERKASMCFDLDSAYQGEEGLLRVQQSIEENSPYSVAFVDVRMPPGLDGIKTAAHMLKKDAELHIVICTAYSDYDWDEMLETIGDTDRVLVLKKPFDTVEVRQLAYALAKKWLLHREVARNVNDLERMVYERTESLRLTNESLQNEITHRERMETKLRLAQKLEAVGQLAAGIAHEINTPTQYIGDNVTFLERAFSNIAEALMSYHGLLEVAEKGEITSEHIDKVKATLKKTKIDYLLSQIPRSIEQSLEGTHRVATIVRAMKEFSHPSTGEKEAVDIHHAIQNTLTVARNEWKYVAEATTEFDPAMPSVECLPDEFNQVMLNIIVNAAHAISDVVEGGTKGKGTITITTHAEGDFAEIRVHDTGSGIPDAIKSKIFDPFFTTKQVGKGTGQGLAIAYSVIVDKHGGTIDVESEMGRGSTFIIRLPIRDALSERKNES